jgi:hypothetical protein
MKYKLSAHLSIAVAVCLAYPEIASACGCSGSTSFTMSGDDLNNVYATATMSLSGGGCTGGDVTATITAPDETTASAENGVGTPPTTYTTTATKAIGTLERDYSGLGTYSWSCDPAVCGNPSSGSYANITQIANVRIGQMTYQNIGHTDDNVFGYYQRCNNGSVCINLNVRYSVISPAFNGTYPPYLSVSVLAITVLGFRDCFATAAVARGACVLDDRSLGYLTPEHEGGYAVAQNVSTCRAPVT